MHTEIVLAGFGGQGVLLIGKLLAYAAMKAGREVTWMPAYGPEMRGGTCNCTVVLSDRPIGSPISKSPHGLIVLNLPSLDKFEDTVRPGGIIVVNTSLINRLPRRTDVIVVAVPANELALECGNAKAANMVTLGAYLGASGITELEQLPPQARAYLDRMEELSGAPISLISTGPRREETILARPLV